MNTDCLATSSMIFANDLPWWVWLGVIVIAGTVLTLTYWRIGRRTGDGKVKWLLLLRLLGVAALLIVMAGPVWKRTTTRMSKPTLWVVLDDSASMSLPVSEPAAAKPGPSRFDRARHWLTQSPAAKDLLGRFDLNLLAMDGRALAPNALPGKPAADQTDIARALHQAANHARAGHSRGIILISDGRDTTPRTDWLALNDLGQPVYTLGFPAPDSDAGQTDIALTEMTGPDEALVHHQVSYQLTFQKHGKLASTPGVAPGTASGVASVVTLWHADKALATAAVTFPANASQAHVTLTFEPQDPGDFVLEARVPVQPGEANVQNNSRQTQLRVTNEPMRVLYIEGQLRPEFTFLKARLADDPDVDLITFVRTGSTSDISPAALSTELLSQDRLEKIDVVLIGDINVNMLSPATWDRLARWVNAGGGLMVLGGYHNLLPGQLAATPIGPLLPVSLDTPDTGRQINEPFGFQPTAQGLRDPVLSLGGQQNDQASPWTMLPSLGGLVVTGPAKPGAAVLARFPQVLQSPATSSPATSGYVVLATQNAGQGRTAILTVDTTWRWSRIARLEGQPDTLYVRFWSQMIRYLARRPAESDEHVLTLSTDASSYEPGSKATLRIRRNLAALPAMTTPAAAGGDDSSSSVRLTIRKPGGQTTSLVARATSSPDLWTADYFPEQAGRYEITAQLITRSPSSSDHTARTLASTTADLLVQGQAMELQNTAADPAVLQQIAQATRGGYALLDDEPAARDMLGKLVDAPVVSEQTQRTSVWNNPVFFLLFLCCVSVEWIIRRRHRMM
jgi:uncharacterized membrane protein